MATFTIKAGPGTDIWRKPPQTDVFDAPYAVPPGATSTDGPLTSFVSARVSFSLPAKELYDQAGLLLSLRPLGSATLSGPPPKWIKTSVEFYQGSPKVGTVACDAWADWSLAPVHQEPGDDSKWVTFAVEKGGDEPGTSLWVYQIVGSEKVPIREICWVYGDQPETWHLSVAAFAARPAKGATEDLVVEFKGFDVQWSK